MEFLNTYENISQKYVQTHKSLNICCRIIYNACERYYAGLTARIPGQHG